ncbi:acetyl-CoA carboxylase carboxyl transferase subunit [Pseudonocardia spinosispora]|uniref:acetyl-CoA carboxylase carboxyl transferase subunit n=1 Tax=Pseudonocardia spinosispora TaxID=103441 RepID=UPI000418DA61|nr:acetyl-CoA carboxylase carboxyl transferase subunit [Pseudonocardia spinosispora]
MTAILPATRASDAGEPEWTFCPGCRSMLFHKRWVRNLKVCPECGRHGAVTAPERLDQLLDPGSLVPLDCDVRATDPLGFTDTTPYPARLAEARRVTGLAEAVLGGHGTIEGQPVAVACMDFRFLGGSLSGAAGEILTGVGELALRRRIPLLIVAASGGARMQEGALSLMQMAKTSAMLARLDAAGVLSISLITDPTFGGVAASFATLCDVLVAEPGARLGFAGRRVIEQTIGERLPADFQTAEFLLERGFLDFVAARRELRPELAALLRAGRSSGRDTARRAPVRLRPHTGDPVVRDPALVDGRDPVVAVRGARRITRPTTLDYAALLLDGFRELFGDRVGGDCAAVVGGVGRLHGRPIMLIGHQKGHDPAELTRRNFGMPNPAGYRKAARLMRLAQKLGIPVVTLVDTPGAYPGRHAEEQGQAVAIADNLKLMAALRVPIVTVVTGEGGSGGALALALANRVLMWEDAVYSVISPEGCAAILWNDPAASKQAAAALKLQARDLLELGIVDGVIPEPPGGVDGDPLLSAERLGAVLTDCLDELCGHSGDRLSTDRQARFARFGAGSVSVPSDIEEAS